MESTGFTSKILFTTDLGMPTYVEGLTPSNIGGAIELTHVQPQSPLYIEPIKGNIGAAGELVTNIEVVFDTLLERIGTTTCMQQKFSKQELEEFKLSDFDCRSISSQKELTYGRSTCYVAKSDETQSIVLKKKKENESLEDLEYELKMLQYLSQKKTQGLSLLSTLPRPLGVMKSLQKPAIAFQTDPKYYHYLSEIVDENLFLEALGIAAYDLGFLLTRNIGFPQLLSTLHGGRNYTCFPSRFCVQMGDFPEFAGRMADTVDKTLYENIGLLGLRDFADAIFVDEWKFMLGPKEKGLGLLTKELTEPEKVMHFLSLYFLVFGILIAKRAENFEKENPLIWERSTELFVHSYESLMKGLGVNLNVKILIDSLRFNEQMKFAFTKNRDTYDLEEYMVKDPDEGEVVRTKPTSSQMSQLFGPEVNWKVREKDEVRPDYLGYSKDHGFGKDGQLGTAGGPLPLIELMHCNYQIVACTLDQLYLGGTFGSSS